ncbi:MAG TPA: hypothetical protein VFQ38_17150 [Longimicrobiales bacterium]|nr:hypothetical protein [Longimicrobiales bacterium]
MRGNAFEHESAPPAAVRVEATAANIVVFGNRLLSDWGATVPFVNAGRASNLGTFRLAAGDTAVTLAHPLVQPTSTVLLTQTAGAPLADSVTPGDESLRVTFTAPARGDEAFRYEIDP